MYLIMENKNIIVTGANRGIGRACVLKMASEGGNVWACARSYSDAFEEDMKNIANKYGVWIQTVYFDLEKEDELKHAIMNIIREKKPIDVLINNAGIAYSGLMQMTSVSKLKEVFQINYFSQILLIQLVSKVMMRQKSGNIINMASAGGIETKEGYLAYGSSKAAIIWATKTIARELGIYNIRVNAVAPGLTDTEMGRVKSKEEIAKTVERTSLRRIANIDEVTETILFLASDRASFITGHILSVDGGRT